MLLGLSIRASQTALAGLSRKRVLGRIGQCQTRQTLQQPIGYRSWLQKALDLIKARYADFGPTLAHEKLTEMHRLRDLQRERTPDLDFRRDLETETSQAANRSPNA
jgi:hypothetical protein